MVGFGVFAHLKFMDRRFLKKVYRLPNSHKMGDEELRCRRGVIDSVISRSDFDCKTAADVWAFDEAFRPDWAKIYGPYCWPCPRNGRIIEFGNREPGVVGVYCYDCQDEW